ncbi:ABC transporter ATP-binding protein [Microbacterium paraoxydans]|uniref:ABC transporter ATP-binding protein n=1 Tax=Microbacterium paraoxydans TaxID=199592 RepID=UPI001CFBE776|nr:ABC transporter ATP-binding protein [Microbacterium paraoxydans]
MILAAQRVHKRYGDEVALRDVSLEVRAGSIHALVGLNGAGKTTLMRSMLAMIRPDAGQVSIRCGDDMVPGDRLPRMDWRHVGHMIETPFTYAELTVTETVVAAARLHGMGRTEAPTAARAMIEQLELGHWAHRRTHSLSLGNRQRLGLAGALVHRPRLLILDEPANGLDPAGVHVVRGMLQQAAAGGAAVLISSHHLDEMARIADTISVMHRGALIGTLPPRGIDIERQFFDMVAAHDGLDRGGAT